MSGKRKSESTISAPHEEKNPKDSQSIIVHSSGATSTKTMTTPTSVIQNSPQTLLNGWVSAQKALNQLKIECVEKTSKIQALKITKFRLNKELASTHDALEETRVECVESRSEIQALRNAKIKLEKQLEIEAASKKSLEELRQDWAVKVYQSDRKNEDLVNLLSLEPEKLFKKYEEIMKSNDSNLVKVEEGHDNSAIKDKRLTLQILQRDLYEKELHEIMDVLKMPSEDRVHANILPMIKNLLEQVDTDHYTSAVENLINE